MAGENFGEIGKSTLVCQNNLVELKKRNWSMTKAITKILFAKLSVKVNLQKFYSTKILHCMVYMTALLEYNEQAHIFVYDSLYNQNVTSSVNINATNIFTRLGNKIDRAKCYDPYQPKVNNNCAPAP